MSWVMHPGRLIRNSWLTSLNMTVEEMARKLSYNADKLQAIVDGKDNVDIELAIRFEKAGIGTHDFWINMQVNYCRKTLMFSDTSVIHNSMVA